MDGGCGFTDVEAVVFDWRCETGGGGGGGGEVLAIGNMSTKSHPKKAGSAPQPPTRRRNETARKDNDEPSFPYIGH